MELQLTQNKFSKTISFIFKNIDFYKSSPMVWNDEKNILELKPEKKMKWLKLRFFYALVYCNIGFVSVFKNWHRSDGITKGYGMLSLGGFTWAIPSYIVYIFQGQKCANFLNAMLLFENKELAMIKEKKNFNLKSNGNTKKYTLLKMFLMIMSLGSNWCLVFHSNAMLSPCFPINVGYFFSDSCKNSLGLNEGKIPWDNPEEFGIRLTIVVTGLHMWLSICSSALGIAILKIINGHCISSYINYYTR